MDIGGRSCFQYDFTKMIETLVVMYSPLTCRYKFILARYQYTLNRAIRVLLDNRAAWGLNCHVLLEKPVKVK